MKGNIIMIILLLSIASACATLTVNSPIQNYHYDSVVLLNMTSNDSEIVKVFLNDVLVRNITTTAGVDDVSYLPVSNMINGQNNLTFETRTNESLTFDYGLCCDTDAANTIAPGWQLVFGGFIILSVLCFLILRSF